jgi:hypothetical protein
VSSAAPRRFAALGAALVATALAMAGAPGAGERPGAPAIGPSGAEAADCVPVQRSKTVVKRVKVKRNGRFVKVKRKRKKRWTVCVPPAPAPPMTCAVPSSTLGVTTEDVSRTAYILSRSCVTAGDVSIQLNNTEAMDPHNLWLRRADSGSTAPAYKLPSTDPFEVAPGELATESFNLTAGEWYLWCDLLLHEEQGMNANLTVG